MKILFLQDYCSYIITIYLELLSRVGKCRENEKVRCDVGSNCITNHISTPWTASQQFYMPCFDDKFNNSATPKYFTNVNGGKLLMVNNKKISIKTYQFNYYENCCVASCKITLRVVVSLSSCPSLGGEQRAIQPSVTSILPRPHALWMILWVPILCSHYRNKYVELRDHLTKKDKNQNIKDCNP